MSPSADTAPGPLDAQLEALLFVASEPVPVERLAQATGHDMTQVEAALLMLEERLRTRGLRLQRLRGRVRLVTAAEYGPLVARFLNLEATARLSRAALETLAIIAYRQPITRPQIEAIRGVNSDGVVRSLLEKGLIAEVGRAEGPGRPILYAVTETFLQHFGLTSPDDLPPLESWDDPTPPDAPTEPPDPAAATGFASE